MSDVLRVAVCEHTKTEVVQMLCDGEWVCLHNETKTEDEAEVNKFKEVA